MPPPSWKSLIARHPSLGPWLERQKAAGRGEAELSRALGQFERLSPLDLSVVASSVEDEPALPKEVLGKLADAAERLERRSDDRAPSPEDAAEMRHLFERHPAMVLAGRCLREILLPALERARPFAVPARLFAEHLRDFCLGELTDLSPRLAIGVLLNLELAGERSLIDRDVSLLLKLVPGAARSPREKTALRAAVRRLPAEWGLFASPDESAEAMAVAAARSRQALGEALAEFDKAGTRFFT